MGVVESGVQQATGVSPRPSSEAGAPPPPAVEPVREAGGRKQEVEPVREAGGRKQEAEPGARNRTRALIAVLLLSFVGAVAVAAPLGIPIIFGAVLASTAQRPYRFLLHKLGARSTWAAFITTLLCGLTVAVAGAFIVLALTDELVRIVASLREYGETGSLSNLIGTRANNALERLGVDTAQITAWAQREFEAAASFAASTAAVVVRMTSQALLGLVVALLTMYYALREGEGLVTRIEAVAPLEPRHTHALITEAREVGRTAFLGTLATAIVQGVLAGIGYVALGVPQPVTWGLATALASFLPVIGTMLVWIPVSAWLFVEGHPVRAVFMVAWGILIVTSLADYVIRPRIVGRRGQSHPLLTLIALLGGLEIFGLAGLVIAPILMSVFVAALRLYERELRSGVFKL